MIKVKAAQQRQVETGPSRQAFVEAGLEKTPVGLAGIGVALVTVAIYLKGIISPAFSRPAQQEDQPRGEAAQDETAQALPQVEQVSAETDAGRGQEESAEVVPFAPKGVGKARGSSSAPAIETDQPIDLVTMARAAQRFPALQAFEAPGQNDGRNAAARDWSTPDLRAPAAGGGGGGGGGGGSSSGQDILIRPGQNEPNGPSRNRAPVVAGPVTLRSVPAGETVFIAFAALLAGAVDPDRDALRVVGLEVSAGSFEITDEGILYTAPAEPVGPVRFSFRISDGELSVRQTAASEIVDREPIIGTDGPDSIVGTPYDDRIDALGGNDTVVALGGRDIVVGGDGDDVLDGGDGADTLFGGNGHDLIRAGSGDDIVWAGEGDDTVLGQGGNDVLFGEAGNDSLSGGEGTDVAYGGTGGDSLAGDAGNDALFGDDGDDLLSGGEGRDLAMGGSGADSLAGDAGDDVLHGDEGDDSLAGGTGHDMLLGGAGADTVDAGAGNDVVTGDLDTASDHLSGGEGQDTLDYSQATESLVIDLAQGRVSGEQTGEDTVEGFETVRAGDGDDNVIVGDAPMSLAGGGGDDLFTFRAPAVAESNPQATSPAQDAPLSQEVLAIHEILDFTVGDRIRVGSWIIENDDGEISGQARDGSSRASFELKSIGPGDTLDLQQPFRLRIEERDGHERTVVDVIVDGVDDPDYAIALNGLHSLVYSYVQQ